MTTENFLMTMQQSIDIVKTDQILSASELRQTLQNINPFLPNVFRGIKREHWEEKG